MGDLTDKELKTTRKLNGADRKIEIREYIRTKHQGIKQVKKIEYDTNEKENYYYFDNLFGQWEHEIIKHSKNIIDLIETNDYVNRNRVEDISIETNEVLLDNNGFSWRTLQDKDTILTKEQYNQNCYRLEE